MKSVAGTGPPTPRAVAGHCLILAVPSAALAENLVSGLALGLVSAAVLVAFSPLRTETARGVAVAAVLAVAAATLIGISLSALRPDGEWNGGGAFALLLVFNVLMLGALLNRGARPRTPGRARRAWITGTFFLASLAMLLLVKGILGKVFLYPGGVLILAGLLYATVNRGGAET